MIVRFGTDGIRGVANRPPLTPEILLRLGETLGSFLARNPRVFCAPQARRLPVRLRCTPPASKRAHVLLGRDTRHSGDLLSGALVAGLTSFGVDVWDAGVLPTPGVAHLTRLWKAHLGIVLSASHNPAADNGVKLLSPEGLKVPDRMERKVEAGVAAGPPSGKRPGGVDVGRRFPRRDADEAYLEFLAGTYRGKPLRGARLGVDCAHGAGYRVGPAALQRAGAEVVPLGVRPDGRNINRRCGAMHTQTLARMVRRQGLAAGVALDGDADRCLLVDRRGRTIDGDALLALLARAHKNCDTVVGTVMSNLALARFLTDNDRRLLVSPVGDRWVVEKMLRSGAILGGEPSGHVILMDHAVTGDGILTALHTLPLLLRAGDSIDRLYTPFPQVLRNVPVGRKLPLESLPRLREARRRADEILAGEGRVVLRYSGTEPLVRIMVEAPSRSAVRRATDLLAAALAEDLA